jgi:hypothetical protein
VLTSQAFQKGIRELETVDSHNVKPVVSARELKDGSRTGRSAKIQPEEDPGFNYDNVYLEDPEHFIVDPMSPKQVVGLPEPYDYNSPRTGSKSLYS